MLVLSRRAGERLYIGDGIVVTVIHSAGGRVRLGVEAPREVSIVREEAHQRQPLAPAVLAAPATLVESLESLC